MLISLQEPPIIPVTFLTPQSYAKLRGYEGVRSLNVSLSFRTYEEEGLLLFHQFTTDGHVKVGGNIMVVDLLVSPYIIYQFVGYISKAH